jgi:DNA-directed RNA polymerase specialized sigma24 family protein
MSYTAPNSPYNMPPDWPETPHTLLLQLRDPLQRFAALERISKDYDNVMLGMARRTAPHLSPQDCRDLLHDFYEQVVFRNGSEKSTLYDFYRLGGSSRLRDFLRTCLINFIRTWLRRKNAQKRGGGITQVALQEDDPALCAEADRTFDREWALTLFDNAMGELEQKYCSSDKKILVFNTLRSELASAEKQDSKSLAKELGITEANLRAKRHRLKTVWRKILRNNIARTVLNQEDIEDEMTLLCSVLTKHT